MTETPAAIHQPVGPYQRRGVFNVGLPVYGLILLVFVNFFNAVDKTIISILVESIKREFGLSDTQVGMITGVLAISTGLAAIPIGMLADRINRRNLIATCLIVWGGATAVGGITQTYFQLLLTRLVIGIGEAGAGAPSLSMIADMFPKARRATAASVFGIAGPIGGIAALAAGGWVAGHYGWRTTLAVAGIPGIFVAALLVLTTSEPARGRFDAGTPTVPPKPTLRETFGFMLRCASLCHLAAGMVLTVFVLTAVLAWVPAYFIRSHGMSVGQAGPMLALVQAVGMVGPIVGAIYVDRLAIGEQRWWCWIVAIGMVGAALSIAAFTLADRTSYAFLFFGLFTIAISIWYGPSWGTVQSLAPANMRATITATLMMVTNVAGYGLGTQSVGVVSDLIHPYAGADSLRWSLCLLTLVALWSAVHYFLAARSLREDLARDHAVVAADSDILARVGQQR